MQSVGKFISIVLNTTVEAIAKYEATIVKSLEFNQIAMNPKATVQIIW